MSKPRTARTARARVIPDNRPAADPGPDVEVSTDVPPEPARCVHGTNPPAACEHCRRQSAAGLTFAPPEPPQRSTGWRHLPEERWTRDRIRPAPWNDRVRRMPAAKKLRLRSILDRHGMAGTLNVRAEDGVLIGAHQRFGVLCELIDEATERFGYNSEALAAELERLGVAGGLFRVSPILGIPDAEAAALSVALNNREAQGEFDPMGLAEVLSTIDGAGLDVTDTGYTLTEVESLVTWEPDPTRNGGAKAGGAQSPAPQSASENAHSSRAGGKKTNRPPVLELPADADDLTLAARAMYRLADAEPGRAEMIRAAALRVQKSAAILSGGNPDEITSETA